MILTLPRSTLFPYTTLFRSKLTLNYGLRWENDQPFHDKYDAIVNIDFRWDNSIEPVYVRAGEGDPFEGNPALDRKSTRLNSSHLGISYAVFCLKKKKKKKNR